MKFTIALILCAAILASAYSHYIKRQVADNRCDAVPGTVPTDEVQCEALFYRYTYLKDSNTCVEFIYGGCGGTINNFQRESECETACIQS